MPKNEESGKVTNLASKGAGKVKEHNVAEDKLANHKAADPKAATGAVAVILVRGTVKTPQKVKDTLSMLKLNRKNHCVVLNVTPSLQGMLQKVKDYITWGEISDETFKELLDKRGAEFKARGSDSKNKYSYKQFESGKKKYKPYFRLNPPRKGFGRKGIKVSFQAGGGLGYRGDKMNNLIMRML
jgi:large subunit ribosomal protein L30